MASSAFLVDDPPGNTIAAPTAPTASTAPNARAPAHPAPGDPSSTSHRFPGAYAFDPPPPAPGRKRSYSGPGPSGVAADRPSPDYPESGHNPQARGDDAASPTIGTPGSTDGLAASKKRKTARGSRGVANLTPEQLDRKRANGESPDQHPSDRARC